jgi:peptide/nickel transport system substrate-binding protein
VGTGPWKYKAFVPGQQSHFVRFPNYWDKPAAYADELLLLDITDDSARVNALLAHQVDAINQVPSSQVGVVQRTAGFSVLPSKTGAWAPIYMRVDVKPFNDVRTRQAMRLIANRPQMIEQALSGFGRVANDLYSPFDPCYAGDIRQRQQDIAQAQSLLKQAGQDGMTVELVTSPLTPGIIPACTVFAQNAKSAGVTVNLRQVDPSALYAGNVFLTWPFSVSTWPAFTYVTEAGYADGPNASFNETHFSNATFNSLYNQAVRQVDAKKRCGIIHEMQMIQHNEGGYLIWAFTTNVDAYSHRVSGFVPDKTGFTLGRGQLNRVHFV